jgi:hypothetical protein
VRSHGAVPPRTAFGVTAVAVLALAACVVAALSDRDPTPSQQAAVHAPVTRIQVSSLPESPTSDWSPARPGWATVVALVPARLPTPVPNQRCATGPVLALQFADGTTISYECTLPSTIQQLRARLIALAEETPAQRAEDACKAVAPHDFVNAQATTVGAIHAIPGPVSRTTRAFSNLLSGLPDGAFAAWCWRQPTPHHYISYVVGPHGEVQYDNSRSEGEPPSPGPPLLT